jgi:hypothetical protein
MCRFEFGLNDRPQLEFPIGYLARDRVGLFSAKSNQLFLSLLIRINPIAKLLNL